MKTIALSGMLAIVLFGMAAPLGAYGEEGTKGVVTPAFQGGRHAVSDSRALAPADYTMGTKPVVQFFHRMPEPSLSQKRIREERAANSLATKPVVAFNRKNRI